MATRQVEGRPTSPTERKSRFSTPVDEDAMEFIRAVERYKEEKNRPFPSWTEVLQLLKALGYRKVAPARSAGTKEPPALEG